jgi:hypothetical protein
MRMGQKVETINIFSTVLKFGVRFKSIDAIGFIKYIVNSLLDLQVPAR